LGLLGSWLCAVSCEGAVSGLCLTRKRTIRSWTSVSVPLHPGIILPRHRCIGRQGGLLRKLSPRTHWPRKFLKCSWYARVEKRTFDLLAGPSSTLVPIPQAGVALSILRNAALRKIELPIQREQPGRPRTMIVDPLNANDRRSNLACCATGP
jgi:hypothetical protein